MERQSRWRVGEWEGPEPLVVWGCRSWQISDAVSVTATEGYWNASGSISRLQRLQYRDLALINQTESYSSWWFVMYEWIVDGLSSLFVPFSGEKSAAWPSERGNGVARDAQRQENSRPAKRNYQRCSISHLYSSFLNEPNLFCFLFLWTHSALFLSFCVFVYMNNRQCSISICL